MSAKQSKKKLCWNCDGSCELEDENCPFCGVYLSNVPITGTQDNFAASAYSLEPANEPSLPKETAIPNKIPTEPQTTSVSPSIILTIILLGLGITFLLLALAMLLFSKDGLFTLTWNSDFWALYIFIGLSSLLLGGYYLDKMK